MFFCADVAADNTPAFDAVLKADKKRLALLEEVSLLNFYILHPLLLTVINYSSINLKSL